LEDFVNVDSFFAIGKTHDVCQDYARHGISEGFGYVAVSDGCSSSPDTDFGSRLITTTAIDLFQKTRQIDQDPIITNTKSYLSLLPLNVSCLDATLLFSYETRETIVSVAFGDGVIVSKMKNGDVFFYEISFSSGAPKYLSYLLDSSRFDRFKTEFGGVRTVKKFKLGEKDPVEIYNSQEAFDFGLIFPKSEVQMVMICTDGIQSFADKDFNPVPVSEIIYNLMDIRSYTGEFIKRNTKFFLNKDCKNKGWIHGDDLGVAAIHI